MTQRRILIVDDSEVMLGAAREALALRGYEVATALTLDEMVDHTQRAFDLILMDLHMPQLYGDDIAMALRDHRGVQAKIYLYSSHPKAELGARASEAGLDGYISKLDGLGALVRRVDEILAPSPTPEARGPRSG